MINLLVIGSTDSQIWFIIGFIVGFLARYWSSRKVMEERERELEEAQVAFLKEKVELMDNINEAIKEEEKNA